MNTLLRDRPVFICGHPKSGTSLLRNILDSHPELIVYPEETGFFRRYLPAAEGMDLSGKMALADERLIHIFQWDRNEPPPHQVGFPDHDYSHISYEEVRRAFRSRLQNDPARHDGDILSAAVLAFGEATGQLNGQIQRWVEKSPYNERFAGQIFGWWPEALCIHVVRDPRDNFLSYQRKHPEWKAETFASSWTQSSLAGLENSHSYGKARYTIIRYEDLVASPVQVLGVICDFLHIRFDASLETPSRAGQAWAGNSMFGLRFDGIESASAGRWREALPPEDAGLLWLLGRPAMQEFGYEAEGPIPLKSYLRDAKQWVHGLLRGGNRSGADS